MAVRGARRSTTIEKILQGSVRSNRYRDDDAVRPQGEPELPPDVTLTDAEARLWRYFRAGLPHANIGAVDGATLLALTRATLRLRFSPQVSSRRPRRSERRGQLGQSRQLRPRARPRRSPVLSARKRNAASDGGV